MPIVPTTTGVKKRKVAPKKSGFKQWIIFAIILSFVLVWLLPIFGAIVTSLRSMDDLLTNGFWSRPRSLSLVNFAKAWSEGMVGRYLYNSFVVTIPALIGTLFLSSLTGYALAHYKFKGNIIIYLTFVGGMLIPFQILMIPVFKLSNTLGIYNTYWGLVMIHMVFQMGFCTFFLRNFMKTIPYELSEAARIDGCSEFMIFWKIYLPLSKPALAAVGTLEFTWIFNDYLWALVLIRNDSFKPVTAGLATLKGHFIASWNVLVAGSLLASIPTLIVFIFLQRYFIEGLTMGSGK
ncbi:carbohydrate ABC transporter permease [Halothermothrix orenii]|uniref:Monosaccharide-transporting ATPase n=1 Tax=Halothermothrix orenii (strain H 168 / OCM 544 / DSM 9562) TaxID=373903 RepID=B8CZU3_HALOH|nr:carbohydrate ABC transporter permease [Halothermothrix orenii]ACL70795.1 Monosaccharide-transporting ATPase [Halothermothrix orenii H 168]